MATTVSNSYAATGASQDTRTQPQQPGSTPTYASLGNYLFAPQTPSRVLSPQYAFGEGVKDRQLLNQLLLEPSSPTSTAVDGMWTDPNMQSTPAIPSSSTATFDALSAAQAQDTKTEGFTPTWSDFLMPLLEACEADPSNGSSVSSSSWSDFTPSSSTAQQVSPVSQGPDPTLPSTTTPIKSLDTVMPDLTLGETLRDAQPTQPAQRPTIKQDQVDTLASWLDQDVCSTSAPQRKPHPVERTHSNVSSRQPTRANSPKQKSRSTQPSRRPSNGYGFIPLMDPQGLLWAAWMLNSLSQMSAYQGGQGMEHMVDSPASDCSTSLFDEDCHQDADEHMDEVEGEAERALQRSWPLVQPPFDSMAFAQGTGVGRSSSWPMPLPANLMELQQNFLRGQQSYPPHAHHHPQRSKMRNSISSGSNSARKQKEEVVRPAIRSRRQSWADQRQGRSRSASSASESGKDVKTALEWSRVASRKPPSRTSSISRPSTANSSLGASMAMTTTTAPSTSTTSTDSASSSANSVGFTITDKIILPPRAGSTEEEIHYPPPADTLLCMTNNSGPTISPSTQASEAVEEVANLFPSDLYAPRFTRRGECGREGWCSICPQGDWYSMKRSQYLYHMQFDHGISNLTRRFFHPPESLRIWNDAVSKTDGRCHHCKKWIPISFGPKRKRDWKAWFKHARKCHRDDSGCPI